MKTLVIKQDENSFEKYISSAMKSDACSVENYNYLSSCFNKKGLFRLVDYMKLTLNGSLQKKLSEYNTIILFGERSLIPLVFLAKKKKTKLIFWQWNIVDCEYAKKISRMKKFCEIWTFDFSDAKKYGWNLNTQFYCPRKEIRRDLENRAKHDRALFVGADKDRLERLVKIKEKLEMFGIECDFYVKPDNTTVKKKNDNVKFIENGIDYEKYLEMIKDTEMLLEVTQKNQTGLTLRALEAVFYNKKLLTDNEKIKEEIFYNPNNIFIIGYDTWERFDNFVKVPMQPIPSNILDEYTAERWIENFTRIKEINKEY